MEPTNQSNNTQQTNSPLPGDKNQQPMGQQMPENTPTPPPTSPKKSGSIFAYIAIGILVLFIGAGIGYAYRDNQANQDAEDLLNSTSEAIDENIQQRQENIGNNQPTTPDEPTTPPADDTPSDSMDARESTDSVNQNSTPSDDTSTQN
jgi:hypothetical protein